MKTTALILLSLIAFNTNAKTLPEGSAACLSNNLFEQLVTAITSDPMDSNAVEYLSENGCIVLNADYPVTVLDSPRYGVSHLRAYKGSVNLELWAATSNIID